jgi:hypothetical protein
MISSLSPLIFEEGSLNYLSKLSILEINPKLLDFFVSFEIFLQNFTATFLFFLIVVFNSRISLKRFGLGILKILNQTVDLGFHTPFPQLLDVNRVLGVLNHQIYTFK